MKTVITASGDNVNARFDLRFGRAAWFCVYDEETGKTEFIENENVNSQGGAGTRSVEKMVELKAGKVISGDFGPKAKDLLERFQIQMVILQNDHQTVKDIIKKLEGDE